MKYRKRSRRNKKSSTRRYRRKLGGDSFYQRTRKRIAPFFSSLTRRFTTKKPAETTTPMSPPQSYYNRFKGFTNRLRGFTNNKQPTKDVKRQVSRKEAAFLVAAAPDPPRAPRPLGQGYSPLPPPQPPSFPPDVVDAANAPSPLPFDYVEAAPTPSTSAEVQPSSPHSPLHELLKDLDIIDYDDYVRVKLYNQFVKILCHIKTYNIEIIEFEEIKEKEIGLCAFYYLLKTLLEKQYIKRDSNVNIMDGSLKSLIDMFENMGFKNKPKPDFSHTNYNASVGELMNKLSKCELGIYKDIYEIKKKTYVNESSPRIKATTSKAKIKINVQGADELLLELEYNEEGEDGPWIKLVANWDKTPTLDKPWDGIINGEKITFNPSQLIAWSVIILQKIFPYYPISHSGYYLEYKNEKYTAQSSIRSAYQALDYNKRKYFDEHILVYNKNGELIVGKK